MFVTRISRQLPKRRLLSTRAIINIKECLYGVAGMSMGAVVGVVALVHPGLVLVPFVSALAHNEFEENGAMFMPNMMMGVVIGFLISSLICIIVVYNYN